VSDDTKHEEMDADSSEEATPYEEAAGPAEGNARLAIAGAAFEAATTRAMRRRLRRKQKTLAIVIKVPTAAWVQPIGAYFKSRFGDWQHVERESSKRSFTGNDEGSAGVARDLAGGRSTVGIAADLSLLPSTLVTAADLTIEIKAPSGEFVASAIAKFSGEERRQDFSAIPLHGFDFPDFLAAFRKQSSVEEIRGRLISVSERMKAASTGGNLPDLRSAVEFGRAREWGLALAKDLSEYRAGRLPWSLVDRGAVVFGEPGTGKSLWARMLANLCSVPIIESSVADWFTTNSNGHLNEVIRSQRQTFSRAMAAAPCLLFLDEIDAIPNRMTLSERNRDYWTPLVNDLLSNLDNAVAGRREGVIVIGATNHIKSLDPALIRPGRLERTIEIQRPDRAGTLNILRHHVAGDIPDADLVDIAGLIEGATGAEIMQYVRDARRVARHAKRDFGARDLRELVLPDVSTPPDVLWRICVHEAGHAVAVLALACGTVRSCIVRGDKGGLTEIEGGGESMPTKADIEARTIVTLAGRAAEEGIVGDICIGSGGDDKSDIAIATRLICGLHASAGLGGSLIYLAGPQDFQHLLKTDHALRRKVDLHLNELYRRAIELISENRNAIVTVARSLRARRVLSGDELRALLDSLAVARVVKPDSPSQDGSREPGQGSDWFV
jgi:cell division protease FtsH